MLDNIFVLMSKASVKNLTIDVSLVTIWSQKFAKIE